jgi:hypothetical protein
MWPTSVTGIGLQNANAAGCCNLGVEQLLTFNATTLGTIKNSGIKASASLSSQGLYHYPAVITDPTAGLLPLVNTAVMGTTYPTKGLAAVIKTLPNGRKEMHFFIGFGSFSITSIILNHVWISWGFRQLFPGQRRVYLSTQVDDLFLSTELVLLPLYVLTLSGYPLKTLMIMEPLSASHVLISQLMPLG